MFVEDIKAKPAAPNGRKATESQLGHEGPGSGTEAARPSGCEMPRWPTQDGRPPLDCTSSSEMENRRGDSIYTCMVHSSRNCRPESFRHSTVIKRLLPSTRFVFTIQTQIVTYVKQEYLETRMFLMHVVKYTFVNSSSPLAPPLLMASQMMFKCRFKKKRRRSPRRQHSLVG